MYLHTRSRKKSEEEKKVLEYDFGCGTFDCTSLIHNKLAGITSMKVITTKGESVLGGEDIYEAIVSYFLERIDRILLEIEGEDKKNTVVNELRTNPVLKFKLKDFACLPKETITNKNLDLFKVHLSFPELPTLESISFDFSLSDLEDIVDPFRALNCSQNRRISFGRQNILCIWNRM